MGYFIEVDLLSKGGHDFCKFYGVTVIFSKVLFRKRMMSN
jgi:hypothetical protein